MATSSEILRRIEEQRRATEKRKRVMDILSFPTSSPQRARSPLVPKEEKGILDLIEEGNPAIGFLADKARDIYRNYDVEMQGGIPQIVSRTENPSSDGPLTVVEAEAPPPLFDWAPDYVPAGLTDASSEELGGSLGSEGLGGYGQLPGSGAPASVVTANPEMIKVDGEYQPSSRQDVITGSLGNLMEGMPTVSGRGFKTEGKIQEEADEKARARIWGNYSYDPAEAQSRYEDAMKDIYSKSMMLNAIAALTGGKSRASNFVEMATKRMEMEEAFRDQIRLQSIQRGIYYTEDGVYDPPKNQQEAFDRAMKFGGSADLASKISGYAPADDKTDYVNWYNSLTDETVVKKKGEEPWDNERGREGWVRGTKSAPLAGTERDRMVGITDAYLKSGDFDAAVKAYMKARKPDSTLGWTAGRVKREAEEFLISTMSEGQLDAFTYYPREGEKVDIDSIRESGKIAVMTPEGRKFILNKEEDD